MKLGFTILYLFIILASITSYSQDSVSNNILNKLTTDFPAKISKKTNWLNEQIDKKSEKVLRRMQKQEEKLKRKLTQIDSIASHNFFTNAEAKYTKLLEDVKKKTKNPIGNSGGEYLPYLDSLKGSLAFLEQKTSLLSLKKLAPESINKSLDKIKEFESKLHQADDIKQFISQRKQQLKELLNRYSSLPKSISRKLTSINKKVYYYSAQIREYREMFREPDKLEQKALSVLNKLPAFQKFMKQHSQLSGLFNMPENTGSSAIQTGLQTRSQVIAFMQTSGGTGGFNTASLVQKNIQSAQGQLDQIRNKLNVPGGSGGDPDMPDFKPNNQKTKTFLQRLEYGTDLQTTHGSSFFPITSDLGLSVGYKVSDKNIIGIGASYKVGWGKNINHINISSQGAGFRSFLDMNIKKTLFVSGGFEYNYQQPFNSLNVLYNLNSWQQSGLIGMSKIVSMNTKMFRKTKIQLLWDFLSYQQRPQTQAFKFRVGFNF